MLILWVILGLIALGLFIGFIVTLGFGGGLAELFDRRYIQAKPLLAENESEVLEPVKSEPKIFMMVGNNKVPIDESEIAYVKKSGFTVLRE